MKQYFNTIRKGEELGRRTTKEWKEIGTKEEMVEHVTFQTRKQRNNNIMALAYGVFIVIVGRQLINKSMDNLVESKPIKTDFNMEDLK